MKKGLVFSIFLVLLFSLSSIFGGCQPTTITVAPVVVTQTQLETVVQTVSLPTTLLLTITNTTTITNTLPPVTAVITVNPPPSTVTTTVTLLPVLVNFGVPITSHTMADINGTTGYYGLCDLCHGQGAAYEEPYAGTWDATARGSIHYSGKFTVVPGSAADHTGLTSYSTCIRPGCHAGPTS